MKFKILLSLSTLLLIPLCTAEALLSFYFAPYPVTQDKELLQKLHDRVTQPSKIAKDSLYKQRKNIVDGIFAAYAGYVTVSNFDGEVSFPLMQDKKKLNVLVTTRVTPIFMNEGTVSNFELEEGTPAKMYSFEKKYDKDANEWYWNIDQAELPKDNIIPLATVIIFSKPEKIAIPTGIYLSKKSPHLLLPPIYVKKNVNKMSNALYVLNLKHLFADVETMHKREKAKLLSIINYKR